MSSLQVWQNQDLKELKDLFAPTLTETEFKIFCGIGQVTNLNPFLREIWAVKYGNNAAQIFIGRDGYRKAAQGSPDYDYHQTDAVYSNDVFKIENGEVAHSYNLTNRGKLIGAYTVVKRRAATKPVYVFVELAEYYQGQKDANGKIKATKNGPMKPTLWDTKPATMIKKVSEAQGLRMAMQDMFAGTYDETEAWEEVQGADLSKLQTLLATIKSSEELRASKERIVAAINKCSDKMSATKLVAEYADKLGAKKTEIKEAETQSVDTVTGEVEVEQVESETQPNESQFEAAQEVFQPETISKENV